MNNSRNRLAKFCGLIIVVLCCYQVVERAAQTNLSSAQIRQTAVVDSQVPEFVEDRTRRMNADNFELAQESVWANNTSALDEIFAMDWQIARPEMLRRVSDENYPPLLRNLAVIVLMVKNDETGRAILKEKMQTVTPDLVNVFWLVGYYGVYGNKETNDFPDMTWAEDTMIAALQDRRTVSDKQSTYHDGEKNTPFYPDEIRRLAVWEGKFVEILAKMKSRKSLPVVLSLLKEGMYESRVVAHLGKYQDQSLAPLILQILGKHNHSFEPAVDAAVDLKLTAAVPILLEHFDQDYKTYLNIYKGLDELADASILPVLQKKLPSIKNQYARAEMRMLIIKYQPETAVSELVKLLSDKDFPDYQRGDVVRKLKEIGDPSAVVHLVKILCEDKISHNRSAALKALAEFRTPDSVSGLIAGLNANYSNVDKLKVNANYSYKKEFQQRIREELKKISNQDFGVDAQRWRKWFAANPSVFDKTK